MNVATLSQAPREECWDELTYTCTCINSFISHTNHTSIHRTSKHACMPCMFAYNRRIWYDTCIHLRMHIHTCICIIWERPKVEALSLGLGLRPQNSGNWNFLVVWISCLHSYAGHNNLSDKHDGSTTKISRDWLRLQSMNFPAELLGPRMHTFLCMSCKFLHRNLPMM